MATFQLTEEQFLAANKLALPRISKAVPYMLIAIGTINVLTMLVTGIFAQITVTMTITFFVLGVWSLLQPKRTARKMFARSSEFQQPFTFTVSDEGMEWVSARGSFRQGWDEVVSWKESDTIILVYASSVIHRVIVKQSLSNAESGLLMSKLQTLKKRR